jgi:hypothetical protein
MLHPLTCGQRLRLMMFTGLGPKDALRLPRTFFKQGEIATRRSKTGEPVFWPAPSALTAILSEAPPHSAVTLCANSYCRPWTESGSRASWRKVRKKLEEEARVGGARRGWSHSLRASPHHRCYPQGMRLRRAHHRRRLGAEDHGPPLCQGCRPEAEDAECGEQLRCRGEQTAHKNCQTNLKKCQTAI